MSWTCPACSQVIRHDYDVGEPRPNVIYRCHVCRLELIFDPKTKKLKLAPIAERT